MAAAQAGAVSERRPGRGEAAVQRGNAGHDPADGGRRGTGPGTLPGLAVDFTPTHDSAGQPWNKLLTIGLDPGADLLTLLINLAEQGVLDWTMQGRVLRAFNEGTTLGRDFATGPAPVDLRMGRDVDDAPDDATLEDASSAILIVGENGLQVEVTNPSAVAPWGRWETYQSQSGVSDEGTARLLAQYALDRASGEQVQHTRQIRPYAARWLPLKDYRPGDTVLAPAIRASCRAFGYGRSPCRATATATA
ncbi:hypothetical protein [Nonomuraea polychroma]|uniref:hypothetical protein n=1 Tax=Nonomuraea polychroma TaxID=46176 RepID=UPI000FDDA36B|nr:hypothetical protein [Nonomuraea polychroma]